MTIKLKMNQIAECKRTVRHVASSKRVYLQNIGKAFRRVGEESRVGRHGQAALSGSKPKAPGSATLLCCTIHLLLC